MTGQTVTVSAVLHLFLPIFALASTLVEYETVMPVPLGQEQVEGLNSAQVQQVLQELPPAPGFPGTRLFTPQFACRSDPVCSIAEHGVPSGGPGSSFP